MLPSVEEKFDVIPSQCHTIQVKQAVERHTLDGASPCPCGLRNHRLDELFKPTPERVATWARTGQLSTAVARGLGIIDIVGAVGIFLSAFTRIKLA